MSDKSPIQMYFNKSQKRISFKIKTGYYLEPLTPERRITTVKNGKNIWPLEITEVILVQCNIVSNQYQCTFIPDRLLG